MWQETAEGYYRQFEFKNFREAFYFMQAVAKVAEEQQHHPRWENEWNKVQIWLSTHEAGGKITDKDRHLAKAIDEVLNRLEKLPNVDEDTTLVGGPKAQFKELKLFADGGSRGNPGPSASGYVLLDMNDVVVMQNGVYLGITTNNQAEYHALRVGLEEAHKLGAREVHVFLDSLLVINQMKGIFKIKNRDLWPIHQAIKDSLGQFKRVNFTHVPREMNRLADGMVNQILDNVDLQQV